MIVVRISKTEYNNTIRELLGVELDRNAAKPQARHKVVAVATYDK